MTVTTEGRKQRAAERPGVSCPLGSTSWQGGPLIGFSLDKVGPFSDRFYILLDKKTPRVWDH